MLSSLSTIKEIGSELNDISMLLFIIPEVLILVILLLYMLEHTRRG